MIDVSVIIINYNTKELTDACVKSIVANTHDLSYEIIVVDNGSADGSVDQFSNDERFFFIKSPVNLGFGKANNLGFKYSKGKYVFLLNSDTLLCNNALKLFYDAMEGMECHIACMGCLLSGKDGHRTHSYGSFPTLFNELLRKPFSLFRRLPIVKGGYDGKPLKYINDHCFVVEYVTGADLFIRREVIDKLGLFDPDFFMYYEETEMQFRYMKRGFLSCIIDTPEIIHLEGGSQNHQNRWYGKDLHGLMTCYRKMYGNKSCFLLKTVLFISSALVASFDWRYSVKSRMSYLKKIIIY